MEEWREIPGSEYSVSSEGRVASRHRGGRILRPGNRNGYLMVVLQGNGNVLYRSIHILVATAFLGPRPTPRHQVNHKNGIRIENRVENLEWVTARENKRHSIDVLGRKAAHGKALPQAKVTETEVREIRARCATGETHGSIAADYRLSRAGVSQIARRKNWAWVA